MSEQAQQQESLVKLLTYATENPGFSLDRQHLLQLLQYVKAGAAHGVEPVAWQGIHDPTDLYYRKPAQADVRPLYASPQPPIKATGEQS